jgi:hypothetical protein
MKSVYRFKALSLMFLMLSVMVHGAIPHLHHHHKGEHDIHQTKHSLHHHEDHTGGDQSDLEHEHSLLLWLLECHSHVPHQHEFSQLYFISPQYNKCVVFLRSKILGPSICSDPRVVETYRTFQPYKPIHSNVPHLRSHSLRGPPALG